MSDITTGLDDLRESDVAAAARMHRRAFPGFFLSSLGEPFLREFYRGFLGDCSVVTVVARDRAGTLQGLVVGTIQPAGFFVRLLRRRWLGFTVASVRVVLQNPVALPRLLGAVRYRGEANGHSSGALLSSICVNPDLQGAGVGRQLITEWTKRAQRRGASEAYLTTDAQDNDSVNAFYRSCGWSLAEQFVTRHGRAMNRYEIRLVG